MSEFGKCPSCGRTVHEDELFWFDGWGAYCRFCVEKCSGCGKEFLPNTLTAWNDCIWCDDCLAKEAERLELESDTEYGRR